nr:hypothetical protein [Stakelama sediminis]
MVITLVRVAGTAGALFGLLLFARAHVVVDKVLGIAIVLAGLYMIAVVPRALAHKWRSPPEP